ncbi:hypothetical protein BT96DRAFT_768839, partial [Gymnopus androsaceus JB14]
LTKMEWEIVENLRDTLQAFKDATLYFSRASATVATVIPAMDKLDLLLATGISRKPNIDASTTFSVPMKVALLAAKGTLNRYYLNTDLSRVYHLAMILHPRYKLGYFEDNHW